MKASGLSKVCIFSISGHREVQSKHPLLESSFAPATMAEKSTEV